VGSGRSVLSQTTAVESSRSSLSHTDEGEITALVIAWSRAEPHRVGEIAILADDGAVTTLGRGDEDDAAAPRLRFFRQRPGRLDETPPLASPGLSRRQLLVHPAEGGARLESVGRCAMEVNGVRVDAASIGPGDVVTLGRELVLYCARRKPLIPRPRHFPPASMPPFGAPDPFGILGESPHAWSLRESVAFAAKADRHVLVTGASGSGKELAARAIHLLSERAARRFLPRNAAVLPPGLIDAELFGNARNYPNAGMPERAGLIGDADGGTLFLDEIGELPSELQAHLLRVLDSDGEYQRLGETTTRRSNFRLVAATNRDPSALKHDLAARLPARVDVPRLSDRREDIPLLAKHLVLRAAQKTPEIAARFVFESEDGAEHVRFDPTLVAHLLKRDYPTNVRDLDAVLVRAIGLSDEDTLHLPPELRAAPHAGRREEAAAHRPARPPEPTAEGIRAALAEHGGSTKRAARALGLSSRFVLYRLMKKHGIAVDGGTGDGS
jgi:transcriptional regulator with AAA-type ATPase domain